MEHPPASSAIADHAAIITELRSLLDDANADIARRHLDMNKAMGRVYAAEARIEDRDATIANLRSQLEALNTVSSAVNDGMAILIKDREATIAKLNEHKAGLIRCFKDAVNENADLRAEVEVANKALAEARKDRASIVAFLAAEAKRFDDAARGISAEASYSTAVSHIHERLVTRASLCRTLAAQIERGDDRQGGE